MSKEFKAEQIQRAIEMQSSIETNTKLLENALALEMSQQKDVEALQRVIEFIEQQVDFWIANEVDKDGKSPYKNETQRSAARFSKLQQDETYKQGVEQLREAKNKLTVTKLELDQLMHNSRKLIAQMNLQTAVLNVLAGNSKE